jgi:hypothetical protein
MGATFLPAYQREQIIWESSLSRNEKLLLLCLNSFIGADGRCWPSVETQARMTSLCQRVIYQTRDSLKAKGILQLTDRFRADGGQTSSDQFIDFSAIQTHDLDPEPDPKTPYSTAEYAGGGLQNMQGGLQNMQGAPAENAGEGVQNLQTIYPVRTDPDDLSKDLFFIAPVKNEKKVKTSKLDPERTVAPPAAAPVAAVDPSKPDPFAAQFAPRPWRENGWGKILPKFCEFMVAGKHIVVDGQMNPKTKAMYHVSNLERDGKWDKLEYLWAEYQASLQPARPKAKLATESYDDRVRREMNQHQQREHA